MEVLIKAQYKVWIKPIASLTLRIISHLKDHPEVCLNHSWFVHTLRTFKTERTLSTKKSKTHF